MTYICIKCRKTWVMGSPTAEHSGGVCERCATSYVRARQKRYGFHDCFKRAIEVCSRGECSYWPICNRELIGSTAVNPT